MKLVDTDIKPTVAVTDADVTDFYVKNPDKFQEPEAVRASHIMIRTPDATDEAQKKKAKAEATAVLAELKKGGDFAALAKQHSQDAGSAANGGDMGFVPRGQTAPVFEQAAFALKPGQMSGVVESPFGYHIIKVFAHRDARTVPLQEVKPQVQEFLTQQQMQQKTDSLRDEAEGEGEDRSPDVAGPRPAAVRCSGRLAIGAVLPAYPTSIASICFAHEAGVL